jgi:hypothetical protein
MAEFVFTSPGVKFRERDLTFVQKNISITNLGLVGETLKGPAFEAVLVQDKTEFSNRFGGQSVQRFPSGQLQYQLPYVANAYLEESNQLYVTRVLGLSGYDAGKEWAVVLNAGVDPSTTGVTSVGSSTTDIFTNNTYLGVSLYATGQTGSTFTGFTKVSTTAFEGDLYEFTATTITSTGGTVNVKVTTLSGTSYSEYENMVLATIRSRAYVQDNVNLPSETVFDADTLIISGNTTNIGIGDLFGSFTLRASKPSDTEDEPEVYTVSLNPNASNYLPNVIGSEAKDKKTKLYVESIYGDLIKKLDADGISYGVKTTLIDCSSDLFTNYNTQFKTPETPWVVSQIKGSEISRLFKFISISDGDAANEEIKISITNINPITLEFDVIIRSFYDTDANPSILETYTKCSLIKGQTNYIAQRIGTSDGEYDLKSKYIMLELAENITADSFPAGFEGYMLNNYSTAITNTTSGLDGVAPKIFYKTSYTSDERIARVYLGLSNSGNNGTGLTGEGINQNIFNYNGWKNSGDNTSSGYTKSKGFHMDVDATGDYYDGDERIGEFEVGSDSFKTINDVVDTDNAYYNLNSRKFTLVPSGGFDGWDIHRTSRSFGDLYKSRAIFDGVTPNETPTNDFQAWETAINTFANPEEVTINLFATPGLNWSDNNILIKDTIEMLETKRTDSLYIIDTPDVNIPRTIGGTRQDVLAAQEIADLLDNADIDSNYSCTYFPWIQIRDDQNNINVYIPPTGEVVKAIAYTDKVKFPWFAPAGLNRGVTDARKSKYRLSVDARDILYDGRINPIADFSDVGTAIFGQKTLQKKDSALTRINVRRLLLQAKVLISNVAIRLVFDQNDQTTIDQFISKVTPILDTIKRERGLFDFQIKMDDSNNTTETRDRNELYGEIFLKPTLALEFLGLTFTITPSGASFTDVGA